MLENQPVGDVLADPRPKEVSIATSVVAYDRDDEKSLYFGYRACGFSVRETLKLIDRSKAWLSACRHNPSFVDLEARIPEFRQQLSKEYVEIDFFRNFRLVLEKDFRVLNRSLGFEISEDGETIQMTREDNDYLLKLRSQYTPQQLSLLETVIKGGADGFNFARWISEHQDVIQLQQVNTVTLKRPANGEEG
jgi:hypothetical protein